MALEALLVVVLWCAALALGGYLEERWRTKDDGAHVVNGRPRW
jgi:hypothetical protein